MGTSGLGRAAASMVCAIAMACSADEPYAPTPPIPNSPPGSVTDLLTTVSPALSWSSRKSLPAAVRAAAASASAGRIYLFGGNLGAGSYTAATRIYTRSTNTWASGASFPKPRDFAMAAAMTDGVHLIGGAATAGVLSDHQLFRPATNTWVARAPLPTAVTAAVARVVGGKLYIIGGGSAAGPTGKVQVFDPVINTWVLKRPMPTARLSAASAVIDGRIYVAGGQTAGIRTTGVLERYDPAANTWTTLPAMPAPREALSGGNVGGQFCVAGGRLAAASPTGHAFNQTYCYDPVAKGWAGGPTMITPRAEAASAESGGALYTLGGRSPSALTTRAVEQLEVQQASGSLRVVTVTSGPDQDADGYVLTVDGGPGQHIGANAEDTVKNLTAGVHTVLLSGIALNCTVAETPSRSVSVAAADQTSISFVIACLPGPALELVSARDHIPGSFTVQRAVNADRDRIYLGSAQGKLFVLARDRAADFPLVQTVDLGVPITGVRGDAERLYVSTAAGLRVLAKGSSLSLIATPSPTGYLGTVEVLGSKVYVTVGQAKLAVDSDRLYLAQLNQGEVALELDKATLAVTRTYGQTFVKDSTRAFDRVTGTLQATIRNPPISLGTVGQPDLYPRGTSLMETVPGCCGSGITIVKIPEFVESDFISEPNTNAIAVVQNGFWSGMETGTIEYFDSRNQLLQRMNLRNVTGHTGSEDIEIRSVWADGFDELMFAASSWGNDASRSVTLPAFFVLRRP